MHLKNFYLESRLQFRHLYSARSQHCHKKDFYLMSWNISSQPFNTNTVCHKILCSCIVDIALHPPWEVKTSHYLFPNPSLLGYNRYSLKATILWFDDNPDLVVVLRIDIWSTPHCQIFVFFYKSHEVRDLTCVKLPKKLITAESTVWGFCPFLLKTSAIFLSRLEFSSFLKLEVFLNRYLANIFTPKSFKIILNGHGLKPRGWGLVILVTHFSAWEKLLSPKPKKMQHGCYNYKLTLHIRSSESANFEFCVVVL